MTANEMISASEHSISSASGQKYVHDFRAKYAIDNIEGFPYSEAFNKAAIMRLIGSADCIGLRIFSGLKIVDGKNEIVFVLMGIDGNGANITPKTDNVANGNGNSGMEENGIKPPAIDDGGDSF